jgi:hypothetical protein
LKVVLLADLIWTSPKIEQHDEGKAEHTQRLELDNIEEVKVNATLQFAYYFQGLRRHYNKSTQPRSVQVTGASEHIDNSNATCVNRGKDGMAIRTRYKLHVHNA